jgi:DNA-binding winged helix-turn-helix (wHTH) protein
LSDILQVPNYQRADGERVFDAVWPGVAVEENTLQVHVSALRKLLGPSLIVTVHGRGYKYTGPPPVETGAATAKPALAAAADHKPVIVVLPFDNLSGDPSNSFSATASLRHH